MSYGPARVICSVPAVSAYLSHLSPKCQVSVPASWRSAACSVPFLNEAPACGPGTRWQPAVGFGDLLHPHPIPARYLGPGCCLSARRASRSNPWRGQISGAGGERLPERCSEGTKRNAIASFEAIRAEQNHVFISGFGIGKRRTAAFCERGVEKQFSCMCGGLRGLWCGKGGSFQGV